MRAKKLDERGSSLVGLVGSGRTGQTTEQTDNDPVFNVIRGFLADINQRFVAEVEAIER